MMKSSKVVFRHVLEVINKVTWPLSSVHLTQQYIQVIVTIPSKITCHLGEYFKRDIGF